MGKGAGVCEREPVGLIADAGDKVEPVMRSLPQAIQDAGYGHGWAQQPTSADVESSCFQYHRQLHPWFLQESVVKDDVYYFEARPRLGVTIHKWQFRCPRPHRKLEFFEPIDPKYADEVTKARESLFKEGFVMTERDENEVRALLLSQFGHANPKAIADWVLEHGQFVPQSWAVKEHPQDTVFIGHAEVINHQEPQVTKALTDAGAYIAPNPVNIAAGGYAGQFGTGKCLELKVNGGTLRYVPHFSVGARAVLEREFSSTFYLTKEELLALKQGNGAAPKTTEDFLTVRSTYKGKTRDRTWEVSKLPAAHRDAMLECLQTGEIREYNRDGKDITEEIIPASKEAVIARGWQQTEDGFVQTVDDPELDKLIEAAEKKPYKVELQWKVRQPLSMLEGEEESDEQPLHPQGFYRRVNAGKLPKALKQYLPTRAADKHDEAKRARREFIPHDAPMSERGQLKTEGMDADTTLRTLQELGLAHSLAPQVPYKSIYGDGPRRGRVLPLNDEFASGAKLKMPDGYMVMHGLTGASGQLAIQRLDSIIATGGLQSIAERRRLGINVNTTCPEDDTVARIDQGVSTAIVKNPIYGGSLHFLMKPEILMRRDLWFANTSPGSGMTGYQQYTEYGQSLGQDRIWHPCPTKGKQKHLDNIGSMQYNELYLQHAVPWSDIDTVVVSSAIANEAKKRIEAAKKKGLIPNSLRVEVSDSTAGIIQSRSKQLGSTIKLDTNEPSSAKPYRKRKSFFHRD